MSAARQTRRGRPSGSANREYVSIAVDVPRCPECGCTERTRFEQPQTIESREPDPETGLLKVLILRRCQCLHCKAHRIETATEYRRPLRQQPSSRKRRRATHL